MSSHCRPQCMACGNRHEKQAFVSHARKDKELAEKVRHACCEVNIASFLLSSVLSRRLRFLQLRS